VHVLMFGCIFVCFITRVYEPPAGKECRMKGIVFKLKL
jgi:hypothetical protein